MVIPCGSLISVDASIISTDIYLSNLVFNRMTTS